MKPLLKDYRLHGVLWLIWFVVLWQLSSGPLPGPKEPPPIPFLDKILHWGYFGIGGALSTFALLSFLRSPRLSCIWAVRIVVLGAFIGALDEWHQTWYPFRSGNDMGDFLADVIGIYSGYLSASYLWRAWLGKPHHNIS